MRESLTIVTTSIREGGSSFEGRIFTARWAYSAPRRADMPVMISALSPRMLELAGELADGVVLWMCTPRSITAQVIPIVTAGRRKAGTSIAGLDSRTGAP